MSRYKKLIILGASFVLFGTILLLRTGELKQSELSEDQPKTNSQTSEPEDKGEKETDHLVTRVIDGDTIVIEGGEVVRYIGIDTPEVAQGRECYSTEASNKNKELVEGKMVRLEKDVSEKDRYQRLLRYVYIGDTFVNEYLVREGYATAITYPPDVKYQELFRLAERQARESNKGLWKECGLSPSPSPIATLDNGSGLNKDTGGINCSTNSYNCSDFKTQAEAQAVFETCGGSSNDIHRLDRDGDSRVCETLP